MSSTPRVTVLMPVFNGERYLREAIDSILAQTFRDFELLIIDDGSTDGSEKIILSHHDSRIRYISYGTNRGLIATLNRGIAAARGEYIARMDCDDISLPERLAQQVAHLDSHSTCAMVAAKAILIDTEGGECGSWNDDDNVTSSQQIIQRLPRANCIVHPSTMLRTALLSTYGYDPQQRNCEDYDLWLRLAADGLRIDKLDQQLLKYRINPLSVTAFSNRKHPDLKNVRTKTLFVKKRLKQLKLNIFTLRVFLYIFLDLYYYFGKMVLDLIFRFVAGLGMLTGNILPIRNNSGLFFFFPFFHLGGAEIVHRDMVTCFKAEHPWVYFTKRSPKKDALRGEFAKVSRIFNWWLFLKYSYPFSAGFMAGIINRHPRAVVFGCNTLFFYKLLPLLSPGVRKIDLIHAFGGGAELFSLPVVPLLDRRVVITQQTAQDLAAQYRSNGIDPSLGQRVLLIENRVDIPKQLLEKRSDAPLQLLYVGRGTEEKRVHLVGIIAARCARNGLPVEVTLVGDAAGAVAPVDRDFCRFAGELSDRALIAQQYD
ncbi:MAG: glycosyltransferase, partial [Desulfuromonadales bacterium]|nr:glycosyltransferase [Desulfuromonadales bacterium]